jgi:hypothetical protein
MKMILKVGSGFISDMISHWKELTLLLDSMIEYNNLFLMESFIRSLIDLDLILVKIDFYIHLMENWQIGISVGVLALIEKLTLKNCLEDTFHLINPN